MYYNKSLKKYLEDLAAKKPAPGGGAAAALSGALGAALISMVVNFTLGKPKYELYQQVLKIILKKSEKLRKQFLALLDLDVLAYQSKDINKALAIPLKVCQLSLEGIRLCPLLVKKGNVNLISDVAVAAVMLESAFASAYFNVEINLKFSKDNSLVKKVRPKLGKLFNEIKKIRRETEVSVGKIIRG